MYSNAILPCPPYDEQIQIINFLDHETAKIDTLIHEQKRLIELLKEKRQAVISHAVTKGLDPDVPMKDSGVEWLGEVPVHWSIARYKNVTKIVQGLAFNSKDYVQDSNVISVRMGNIRQNGIVDLNHNSKFLPQHFSEQFSGYSLFEGDLIIAMTDMSPTLDFLAVPATITGTSKANTYLLNQRVGKLIVMQNINQNFLKLCLLSLPLRNQLKGKGLGTVQANMSNDDLYTAFIGLPPLTEQSVIAEAIQMTTSKIDLLTKSADEAISLLKERRSALISAAVTGKIDVRNWQPPADESAFNEAARGG
jgi:type I restriction enzyme S subunit